MKKYLLFGLSLLLSLAIWAQGRTVTGTVTDGESGETVPGATVVVKGTTNGTITDFNGQYSLNVSGNDAVLVVSFVGYTTQEVSVGARSVVDVNLELNVEELAEVVVIGYGQVEQSDATGAVMSVSSKDFNQGMIASPEQLIAGKTAGVQITSTSGNPGDGVQLRIRGTSSVRSNNNPLFVVDGVPLAGGTQPSAANLGFGTTSDTNPLNFINPNDIESISILKDASATAIYGSRGANGVVIITTKGGKGKGSFDFSSNVSISSPRTSYDLLNADEYIAAVQSYGGTPMDGGADTDWQDFVTRTSVSHKENLSYSKGFETGSIRVTAGYEDQQGVMESSYMKRLTGRVNGDKSFMDGKLNVALNATISHLNREDPALSGNAGYQGDILGAAYSANPTWPTDPDFATGTQRSPANLLEYFQSTSTSTRLLTNLSVDYELTDGLTAKVTYGIDMTNAERLALATAGISNAADGVSGNGMGQINVNQNFNNLVEATLNHSKKYGDVQVDLVAGYSLQTFHDWYHWTTGYKFSETSFDGMETELRDNYDAGLSAAEGAGYDIMSNWAISENLDVQGTPGAYVSGFNGVDPVQSTFEIPSDITLGSIVANYKDKTDYLQSYFARANFTIAGKYLLTATVRADGSSRFGGNNRYGIFPSGAVAWKVHEEAFMPDAISTFKLRAGYGVVGNQDGLGHGAYLRLLKYADAGISTNSNQVNTVGTDLEGNINPDLKWESTAQTSIGVDFGILGDRLNGSFDWYNKQTSDLLLNVVYAQPAFFNQRFENIDAIVENKGWELTLNYAIFDSRDASVSIGGNISKNNNLMKDFGGQIQAGQIFGQGLSRAYAQILAGGHPLFSYYLREFEGFDSNGQPIGDNQTFVDKSALPVWNSGISLNASYKDWSLSAYMYGQFGHYIYNNTENAYFTAGAINNSRNVTKNVIGNGEAGSAEAAVSTRFLEKGDFWRMQNIILAYRVPLSGDSFINNLRVSFTAQNLFVITDYSGLDPEVSTNPASFDLLNGLPTAGIDYSAYPRPRVFSIGVQASF